MMTWLPSMVIIVEKMNMKLCKCWQSYVDSINVLIERFGNFMENAIIHFVDKFRYAFLVIFCKLTSFKTNYINNTEWNISRRHFFYSFDWDFKWCYCFVLSETWIARLSNVSTIRKWTSIRTIWYDLQIYVSIRKEFYGEYYEKVPFPWFLTIAWRFFF